ncbi:response regulator [Pseudomonas typographi]|uniref:Response regulator n=1 Tax=Pseudomonas typographi TaxID=2715964 RepID=A0ABR7Z7Y6_9PSED|nr:response regulator [Pseudomonas typographi]MBD1553667.1 response regulator [Pseudomonas typographi]MBD1589027.1 response regulator [Pseudomonas typographi]MBD1601458.1 response regulator [Pseudomonas typographi]
MHSLDVLVVDRQPGQLLSLHQALNACGVFKVRVADTAGRIREALRQPRPLDIALLDSRLDLPLLDELSARQPRCALVLRGEGPVSALELQARQDGLWVLGHLPWNAPVHRLHALLGHYRQLARPGCVA